MSTITYDLLTYADVVLYISLKCWYHTFFSDPVLIIENASEHWVMVAYILWLHSLLSTFTLLAK